VEVVGEVLEIAPPDRIVFTWGNAGGKPIAEGGSRVTILLEPNRAGTRLHLLHEFTDEAVRDEHVQGWRFQLALFANVVADENFADANGLVDAWFNAWALQDHKARDLEFARIAAADVRFRDRFSLLDGLADLSAHAGASQRFMPGIRMRRKGEVRHCQGTIVADWVAISADGQERMSGINVFVMGPDGRIDTVTGLMNLPPSQ
jgi:Activator of Hsp90 ATPase homolog 1-like protein